MEKDDRRERGSSDAGTETKEPNSESESRRSCKWGLVRSITVDDCSSVGDARGVGGAKRVENLSIIASASCVVSADP